MRTKPGSYPAPAPAKAVRLKGDAPEPTGWPSALVDTRVIYWGDNLEQHYVKIMLDQILKGTFYCDLQTTTNNISL
jgi:hypothetical protein